MEVGSRLRGSRRFGTFALLAGIFAVGTIAIPEVAVAADSVVDPSGARPGAGGDPWAAGSLDTPLTRSVPATWISAVATTVSLQVLGLTLMATARYGSHGQLYEPAQYVSGFAILGLGFAAGPGVSSILAGRPGHALTHFVIRASAFAVSGYGLYLFDGVLRGAGGPDIFESLAMAAAILMLPALGSGIFEIITSTRAVDRHRVLSDTSPLPADLPGDRSLAEERKLGFALEESEVDVGASTASIPVLVW